MTTCHITITDPRQFDGDPYQVAERSVKQLSAMVRLVITTADATGLMVRNSELERCLASGMDAEALRAVANGWSESPQGRILSDLAKALENAEARLRTLERAASYNPKAGRGGRPAKARA